LLNGRNTACDILAITYDSFPQGGLWKGWQDYTMSRYSFWTAIANLAVIVDAGYETQ
jgi:hypothetical protein